MTITLNQDFKKSVSTTDINKINSVIIGVLKPMYEGENKQAKLLVVLGAGVWQLVYIVPPISFNFCKNKESGKVSGLS